MSSKSKKKDKKKSKTKSDKIKLQEVDEAADSALLVLPDEANGEAALNQKSGYKVKVLPSFNNTENDQDFEKTAAEMLDMTAGDDCELVCVISLPKTEKIVAFFKPSK